MSLAVGRLARRQGLTPTGIDRFEQAYMRHFGANQRIRFEPVVPTGRGFRRLDRDARLDPSSARVFVQVSHSDLDRPERFARLPAARKLFYLHDVIPIDWPEFCRDGEAARHRRRIETVRAHADAVMVNSAHTAARLGAVAGPDFPPIVVNPPGVEGAFGPGGARPADEPAYFVALSSVEARKNVGLLFALWQRLAEARGEQTPRLVLVGADGIEPEALLHDLAANPVLVRLVERRTGLDDAAVAHLLAGARALLAPSFAEGYGMSIAEALAVGTPVIASDLPSHREVGGPVPIYLDPLDGLGWLAAIDSLLDEPPEAAAHRRASVAGCWTPRRWTAHFEVLERLLDTASPRAAVQPIVKNRTSL